MTAPTTPALHAAIKAHVQKFGPCSLTDIAAAVLGLPQTPQHLDALRLRLKKLTESKVLNATGFRETRRWTVTEQTEPRQYEPVQPSSWTPPAGPALRPGCDEHIKAPSLRNGQRVDYVPGRIIY